ncbi:MAG: hypothetical protein ACYCZZ_00575 [Minisyncoccota bacterium]
MKVTNECSFELIAFGWHKSIRSIGYGDDVRIPAGDMAEVNGPLLSVIDGEKYYLFIPGEIICREKPDGAHGFQVVRGAPLGYSGGGRGIVVRHFADEPDPHVIAWREGRMPSK